MPEERVSIVEAKSPEDVAAIIPLFEAYAHSLSIDLTFQDFATEMSSMPGKYSLPTGSLLLARDPFGEAVGCVGFRPLAGEGVCEMKRLYVDPKGRGLGLGKALTERVIEQARKLGYKAMRLDTLPIMAAARSLYKSLGFAEILPYYSTPVEGTIFLELVL
jgi:putative acetyltransferase